MSGTAKVSVLRLKASQQPKVDALASHVNDKLPGFNLSGSAQSGTVTIIGPAASLDDTEKVGKQLAAVVPPTANPLDQEMAIPDISPTQIEWSYEPDDGGPAQTGGLVQKA
jgi:hypothetical protein